METLIRVELKDGTVCRMAKKAFNLFLNQGKVIRFERSDGWVVVDRDTLRSPNRGRKYSRPERRAALNF